MSENCPKSFVGSSKFRKFALGTGLVTLLGAGLTCKSCVYDSRLDSEVTSSSRTPPKTPEVSEIKAIEDDASGDTASSEVPNYEAILAQKEFMENVAECISGGSVPDGVDSVKCEVRPQDSGYFELSCLSYDEAGYPVAGTNLYAGPIVSKNTDFNDPAFNDIDATQDTFARYGTEDESTFAVMSTRRGFAYDQELGTVFHMEALESDLESVVFYGDSIESIINEETKDALCERGREELAFNPSNVQEQTVRGVMRVCVLGGQILENLGFVPINVFDENDNMNALYGAYALDIDSDSMFGVQIRHSFYDENTMMLVDCGFSYKDEEESAECEIRPFQLQIESGEVKWHTLPNACGCGSFDVFEDPSNAIMEALNSCK